MYSFSYEERLYEIDESIAGYTALKQLYQSGQNVINVSESLIQTMESSLVIALYSLSEQLLKNTLYRILDVDFNSETQSMKDKYILRQIDPESYPLTLSLNRIKEELKLYYSDFHLYLPKIVENYKNAYIDLIQARHNYAHANRHTDDIDFDAAKRFIEYLKIHYEDVINQENRYIPKLENFSKELKKLKDLEDCKNFLSCRESKKDMLKQCLYEIEYYFEEKDDYGISYLSDIYDGLSEAYDCLMNLTEDSFRDDIEEFKLKLEVL